MAPSYANIFMCKLRNLLQQAPVRLLSWLRFIDDIMMKWVKSCSSFDNFIERFSCIHQVYRGFPRI